VNTSIQNSNNKQYLNAVPQDEHSLLNMRASLELDISVIEEQLRQEDRKSRENYSDWRAKAIGARKIKAEQLLLVNQRLNDINQTREATKGSNSSTAASLLKTTEDIIKDLLERSLALPADIKKRATAALADIEDFWFTKQ